MEATDDSSPEQLHYRAKRAGHWMRLAKEELRAKPSLETALVLQIKTREWREALARVPRLALVTADE